MPPRKRRTADGAREEILAAAERRLARDGPAALRLQDIAADVGVSHPAILHHFGSREGLVRAVVDHSVASLQADLVRALAAGDGQPPDPVALLDRVFEVFAGRGHARLIAWLVLTGFEPLRGNEFRAQWQAIIAATHAARTRGKKTGAAAHEDTAFTVVLSALALFAQAIAGPAMFQLAGLGKGADVDRRFHRWLGALLADHLARPPPA